MNRRDILKSTIAGLFAWMIPKRAEAAPGQPVVSFDMASDESFSMTVVFNHVDGRMELVEYVATREAIPTGQINGYRTFRPGPIRFERKDEVEARLKAREAFREQLRQASLTPNELRRLEGA